MIEMVIESPSHRPIAYRSFVLRMSCSVSALRSSRRLLAQIDYSLMYDIIALVSVGISIFPVFLLYLLIRG